jgi:hypothetical protein
MEYHMIAHHQAPKDQIPGAIDAAIGFRQRGFGVRCYSNHGAGDSGKLPLKASSQLTSTLDTEPATIELH